MEVNGGSYRLIRVLGSGGMGVVHEAWDSQLDRRVALKMMHLHLLGDPATSCKFIEEAKKGARIEHPNVVRVYRVGTHEGSVAIEMQYIDGAPLSALLKTGPLSPSQAADLLRQILEALYACHEHGVVHCDLKPGNLLVTRDGHVVLTDFGIARALYDVGMTTGSPPTSITGHIWGTPQYCPPEAWEGGDVTPRWDLYSAGALIYEAVAGFLPFRAQTPAALMKSILMDTPPALNSVRPAVSQEFSTLIADLMARDPDNRPNSAKIALERLKLTPEFNSDSIATEPLYAPSQPERTPSNFVPVQKRKRKRLALLAVLVTITVIVVAVAYSLRSPVPATRTPTTSGASDLLVIGNDAYYVADDGLHGRELWVCNEWKKNFMVADIVPGRLSSNPRRLMSRPFGGLVFAATTPDYGEELWVGGNLVETVYSAELIKDIIPGSMGSEPEPVAAKDNLILFYATTLTSGRELWCTNAVANSEQTAIVQEFLVGPNSSVPMRPRVTADSEGAYVIALADYQYGCKLFRYDFATNAVHEIGDIGEDSGSMARAADSLYLANVSPDYGQELWTYNENTGKLAILADIWPGTDSSQPNQFFAFGDKVLFQARTQDAGLELWISDGTSSGTHLVKDINPGNLDSDPYGFTALGDIVFFRAKTDALGWELWLTDGTPEGTKCVSDIMPGPGDGNPYNLVAHNDILLYTANDGVHGEELWRATYSEGICRTSLFCDFWPGPNSGEPHQLQWARGNQAYCIAKLPGHGDVLCSIKMPPQDRLLDGPVITIHDPRDSAQ